MLSNVSAYSNAGVGKVGFKQNPKQAAVKSTIDLTMDAFGLLNHNPAARKAFFANGKKVTPDKLPEAIDNAKKAGKPGS